jgi:hypothetical protein
MPPILLALAVAAELYVVFDKVLTNSISTSIAGLGRLVMTVFGASFRWNSNHDIGPPPVGAR